MHTRRVIPEQVIHVIQQYEIEIQVEYFIFNNITSYDTYVMAILYRIVPGLIKKEQIL